MLERQKEGEVRGYMKMSGHGNVAESLKATETYYRNPHNPLGS